MRSFLTVLLTAVVFFPLNAGATDVEGDVWGTWTRENSPYNVIGEIRVPPESTLVIEPGILVNFKGHYKLIVDSLATLLAIGTETDSIFFTTEDTATGWHGIRFLYADSNSQISYCRLEYGKALGEFPSPDAMGGAIYCFQSSPNISNNVVRNNTAVDDGGGIACRSHSSPTILNNLIVGNSAQMGGGINCYYHSNPQIVANTISGNSADEGGGVECSSADPVIGNNTISGNSASLAGGIACVSGGGKILNNTISGNSGDGIFCYTSWPAIKDNIISCNSLDGILCLVYASPLIIQNTISANLRCGVTCSDHSSPHITNSILWENGTSEIQTWSSSPTVTYCDVRGGWHGQGNINADPLFVGPDREDYHLRWHSPCIDAGVPDSLDPDGTRSDIGAFYFNQDVPGIVELYPHDTPIVIPRQGGELSFDSWVFNFSGQTGRVDIWTYLFAPEIGRYGPLDLYNVKVPVDSLGLNEISRRVPEVAPEGDYVFVAYIGQYPSSVVDSSYFYFTKEGEVVGVPGDWTEDNLPLDYALFQNHPNPFNAATRIAYQLPRPCDVKLEIYNILGQRVALLVGSKQQAGFRSITWDASGFSSGLYFYKLTAGEFSQGKRMMLVK